MSWKTSWCAEVTLTAGWMEAATKLVTHSRNSTLIPTTLLSLYQGSTHTMLLSVAPVCCRYCTVCLGLYICCTSAFIVGVRECPWLSLEQTVSSCLTLTITWQLKCNLKRGKYVIFIHWKVVVIHRLWFSWYWCVYRTQWCAHTSVASMHYLIQVLHSIIISYKCCIHALSHSSVAFNHYLIQVLHPCIISYKCCIQPLSHTSVASMHYFIQVLHPCIISAFSNSVVELVH